MQNTFQKLSGVVISSLATCALLTTVPTVAFAQQASLSTTASNQIVTFPGPDGVTLRGRLVKPAGAGPFSAVVVMHGCGGLWYDSTKGTMLSQFNEWATIFQQNQMAGIFIDSYGSRGQTTSFCGVEPPKDGKLSPAYVRPKDAYAGLSYLRSLYVSGGSKLVGNRSVALLGFSHGGTSTLAAIADPTLSQNSPWVQIANGVTYSVPPLPTRPSNDGFVTAVSYYPGAGFYSYFGSPTDPSRGRYAPYAPTLVLYGDADPLYGTTAPRPIEVLQSKAIRSGSINSINVMIYAGAAHSFDGKTTGADGTANSLARTLVTSWLKQYLGLN